MNHYVYVYPNDTVFHKCVKLLFVIDTNNTTWNNWHKKYSGKKGGGLLVKQVWEVPSERLPCTLMELFSGLFSKEICLRHRFLYLPKILFVEQNLEDIKMNIHSMNLWTRDKNSYQLKSVTLE